MTPLRVLLVAENASNHMGGEAILPVHYFRSLRQREIDAFLIVHERARGELTSLFPDDLNRMRFVKDLALQRMFYRASLLLPRRVAEATFGLANQMLTQRAQRVIVRRLSTEHSVIHQPIPVSPRFPSLLSGQGSPLVVGPLNGGMNYPPAFRRTESWVSRSLIALGRRLSNAINAGVAGKRHAAIVLVANARTLAALPSGLHGRVLEMPENGVDLSQWTGAVNNLQPAQANAFLFIGRLVEWKALDLAIEAIERVPGAQLEVIGDGPMLSKWARLADSRGLGARIQFRGWLPQSACAQRLQSACGLILPSLYECGGAVVLEAMAMSKPVIATAWGGPADYLDPSCGILVEPVSREALVAGFAEGIVRLMNSPSLCVEMGARARTKVVQQFDWEKKIDAMVELYESVAGTTPGAA
jgi:glycosyltransferase involved in cell wall biosynthesis